ncbi:porin [Agaricicola taiwanensis]|uniref:Porin n=1 Tax=Agaricicola taiwanensis TaxID=591372 RepID=A0A8J3DUI2_9RHOB|nr:outer membrane protein [Agaricicola taiwanensis]GGE45999.1 porin [Agaricicola taiwanensis]
MAIFTSTRAIALAAFGVVAMTGAASAADLPAVQPYVAAAPVAFNWTGFYLGAQVGYGWGEAGLEDFAGDYDVDGFNVGLYGGYNHQFVNNVVVGLEADINYNDADGDIGLAGVAFSSTEFNWDGAVRARLGYAFDRVLVYVAGGVAFADIDLTNTVLGVTVTDSDTTVGWTIGAGVEAAVTEQIAVRAEYRYTNYDDIDTGFVDLAGADIDGELDNHKIMVGVSYKF